MAEVSSTPITIARETLKQLAARRIAPTPDNFRRFYQEISGEAGGAEDVESELGRVLREVQTAYPGLGPLSGLARAFADRNWGRFGTSLASLAQSGGQVASTRVDWGPLLRSLVGQFEPRQTATAVARKKEGLERLLARYGQTDALPEKLHSLLRAWQELPATAGPVETDALLPSGAEVREPESFRQVRDLLSQSLEFGLVGRLERFPELQAEVQELARAVRAARSQDAWIRVTAQMKDLWFRLEVRADTDSALLDGLLRLLGELVNNIGELVDDDAWISGQLDVIRGLVNSTPSLERINAAERSFRDVVYRQSLIKQSLREAKTTLKDLLGLFVTRLGDMTGSTADFQAKLTVHTERIAATDDMTTLKRLVEGLLDDTRSLQTDLVRTGDEIIQAQHKAEEAELRITQLEKELVQASEQVREDPLTGVLNRRGLEEAMSREFARCERHGVPLTLGVLDIDNFKRLNDTYGHQAGDEALIHLTGLVKKMLRPTDTVARYGGEEFVVLFSETSLEPATEVMLRLQRDMTKRFFLHNNERLLITFSAGVAERATGESPDALISRADKAMYQAKQQGKNRVVAAA